MSLTSSEEETEAMDADNSKDMEDDLQRIQQDLETTTTGQEEIPIDTSQDKKRERATDSSEGENKIKKTPKYRSTPYPRDRLPSDSSEIPTDSSDEEPANNKILNSTPKIPQPTGQKQTILFPSTGKQDKPQEEMNKTLVPETPARWEQLVQLDEQELIHDTPQMQTRSKLSTRTQNE